MTNNKNGTPKDSAECEISWDCYLFHEAALDGTYFSFTKTFSVETARRVMNRRQPRTSMPDTPELFSNCKLYRCQNHVDHEVHQVFKLEQPNLQYI